MVTCFTQYWKNDTWTSNSLTTKPDDFLDHTADNFFRRKGVSKGDFVYIVTIIKGKLYLLSRMRVEDILTESQAQKKLGHNIWEAQDHLISVKNSSTLMDFERRVPDGVTKKLTFESGKGKKHQVKTLAFKAPGLLDQQTLRGVRQLTEGAADELDKLLEFPRR